MEPDMRATPLATNINPVQFQSIKQVYDTLISADWFYDTEETRQDLADFIMRQYRKGYVGADKLLSVCESGARERYSERATD
jgi:flavodoxin